MDSMAHALPQRLLLLTLLPAPPLPNGAGAVVAAGAVRGGGAAGLTPPAAAAIVGGTAAPDSPLDLTVVRAAKRRRMMSPFEVLQGEYLERLEARWVAGSHGTRSSHCAAWQWQ